MKQSRKFLILGCLLFTSNLYAQEVVRGVIHGIDYTGYKLFNVDMNLDGKTDEVYVGPASIMTHFATNSGINDVRVVTQYCKPSEPAVYDSYRLSVQDVNGDSIPDLVYSAVNVFFHAGKKDGHFADWYHREKSQ